MRHQLILSRRTENTIIIIRRQHTTGDWLDGLQYVVVTEKCHVGCRIWFYRDASAETFAVKISVCQPLYTRYAL